MIIERIDVRKHLISEYQETLQFALLVALVFEV